MLTIQDAASWWVYQLTGGFTSTPSKPINLLYGIDPTERDIEVKSYFESSRGGIDTANRFNCVKHIKAEGFVTTESSVMTGALSYNIGTEFAVQTQDSVQGKQRFVSGWCCKQIEAAPSVHLSPVYVVVSYTSHCQDITRKEPEYINDVVFSNLFYWKIDQATWVNKGNSPTLSVAHDASRSAEPVLPILVAPLGYTVTHQPLDPSAAQAVLEYSIAKAKESRPTGYYAYGYRGSDTYGYPNYHGQSFVGMKKNAIAADADLALQTYASFIAPRLSKRNVDVDIWPKLAAEAYASNTFWEGNGIALLKDISDVGTAARGMARTISAIPSSKIKKIAKCAASLYLSVHYGWKLLVSDCNDLSAQFSKLSKQTKRCQSVCTEEYSDGLRVEYRYQVYYSMFRDLADSFSNLASLLDLDLDLSNAWDFVPFSFIVDWFTNIGNLCSSIDEYVDLIQRHDVVAVGKTVKASYPLGGSAEVTYYDRSYSKDLVFPSPGLHVTVNPSISYFIDGGALVIQRS